MKYFAIAGFPVAIVVNKTQFLEGDLVENLDKLLGVGLKMVWRTDVGGVVTITLPEPLLVCVGPGVTITRVILLDDVEPDTCLVGGNIHDLLPKSDAQNYLGEMVLFVRLCDRVIAHNDKRQMGWIHLTHDSRTRTDGVAKFRESRPWLRKPSEVPTANEVADVVNQPWARFATTAEKIDSTPKQSFFDQSKVTTALDALKRDVAKANFRGESYILYFKPTALSYDDEIALRHQMPFSWRLTTGVDNDRPITYLHFK